MAHPILFCLLPLVTVGHAAPTPVQLKSRIVEASVFKSGLVMLTREVTVPVGDGSYTLDVVPEASDGTFWYSSPDGLLVTDVTTTLRMNDQKVKLTAQTIGDYLAANIGQTVKLTCRTIQYGSTNKETLEQIEGIVNGPPRGNTNSVPIKLSNGHLKNLALTSIEEIDTTGLKSELSKSVKTPDLRIQFRAQSEKPARLHFVTLEAGATWVGSYLVTLNPSRAATVIGKAQVALGRLSFDDTKVSAVAGQPYMVSNNRYDLNSGIGGLVNYLNGDQDQFLSYLQSSKDPFQLLPQMATEAAQATQWENGLGYGYDRDAYNYSRFVGYGGGMGGGGGGGQVTYTNPSSTRRELAPQATTERVESLFAYPIGKVSLQAGDRLSRILFSQSSTYENIFRWSAEVGNPDVTVKNLLRIHNTGTVPWTGGQVFVTKGATPLAQLIMPFTSAGKAADLELANAQDIAAKKEEIVVSSDAIAMPNRPKLLLPRQLIEVHMSVESSRMETATFEMTITVPGEVVDPNGGKVEKLLARPDGWNRSSRITWSFNLSPGEKREVRMQYRHLG